METAFAYPIGSKVVHPNYGAGIVVGIEEKSIGQASLSYYIIALPSMQLMVPVHRAEALGLRLIGLPANLRAALRGCCELAGEIPNTQDHFARRAALDERLKSGSFERVAAVVRHLYLAHAQRPLSAADHQLLDRGMEILASEFALASGQEMTQAKEEIVQLLTEMRQDTHQA
jgi:CarD family transcriptional regulator